MGKLSRLQGLTVVLCLFLAPAALAQSKSSEQKAVLVGRIAYLDGELLRYVPDEKDWVAAVKDAPFGLDDALYADDDCKAELIMPNSTWIRIGGNTQIQLIALEEEVTEIDVASGIARFHNRSRDAVIKATTPFGYVMAPAGTIFDLYVGDESVEVIALKGSMDFVHDGDEHRYEIHAESTSIVADSRHVTSGEGTVDADWDEWNSQQDSVWARRLEVKGDSVRYLPSKLHEEAYVFEENGRWERAHYNGGYHHMWRPTRVDADWAPFTAGRWTVWYGDNCWIPEEPFGYVTHHYGNWVMVEGSGWYWAPPEAHVRTRVGPSPGIGFGWYPGRVAWIHSGVDIGWFPLAPAEPYYSRRYWGPRSVVLKDVSIANIRLDRYRYADRAVIVNQDSLYNVSNYRSVRITNVDRRAIISSYRAAPVISNKVIKNYNIITNKYNFKSAGVKNKPHQMVLNRIERNEKIARQQRNIRARTILQSVSRARRGKLAADVSVAPPKVSRKAVPASDVSKPGSEIILPQKPIKQKVKPARERREAWETRMDEKRARPDRREPGTLGKENREGRKDRRIRHPREDREPRSRELRVMPGERGPGGGRGKLERERSQKMRDMRRQQIRKEGRSQRERPHRGSHKLRDGHAGEKKRKD